MEFYSYFGGKKIRINLEQPIDISIPLKFSKKSLKAWGVSSAEKKAIEIGSWIGNVKKGGAVNFNNIYFNPHAHVTHTECVGHISESENSINLQLKNFFFFCKLITISPEKKQEDLVISKKSIFSILEKKISINTLIIRTNPNSSNKKNKEYTGTNPPYLTEDCVLYLKEIGIENLLIDLPSIDKEKDGGKVKNHKIFFNLANGGNYNTITEFVYVPNLIKDGDYFLNLQFMPIENDAAPSRPVLFEINYV